MKRSLALVLGLCVFVAPSSESVTRYSSNDSARHGVALSLSDPSGSVYQPGEEVRFTVETDRDAYVVVFDIDTEGFVHLLYPRDTRSIRKMSSGERAAIPRGDESLVVSGKKGMEFVFAISVPERDAISEREISFLVDTERLAPARRFRIDGDPFLAANRIARQIVRGVKYNDDVSMAYTYFYVRAAVDYPRYLCEDCARSGKDPYREGASRFAATAAFDREDGLSYPLPAAFDVAEETVERAPDPGASDRASRDDSAYRGDRDDDGDANVYINYYPVWTPGYTSALLYDPFYYDPCWGYYPFGSPYHGSSFYFGVGFNWGFGYTSYYGYSPYYYDYCPYVGFYGLYDYGHYRTVSRRSLRHRSRMRYKGPSQTAMTSTRPRLRQKSRSAHGVKPAGKRRGHDVRQGAVKTRPVHKITARPHDRYRKVVRARDGRRVVKPHGKTRSLRKPALQHPHVRGKDARRSRRPGKMTRPSTSKRRSVTHRSSHRPSKSRGHSIRSRSTSRSHSRPARSSHGRSARRGKGRK